MSVFKIQKEFLLFKFKTCRYKKQKEIQKRKEKDELYYLVIINNNKKKVIYKFYTLLFVNINFPKSQK